MKLNMHACVIFFFFLMPSTNVEGKNCSVVIDDSTKQKVRSLHSSVFFFFPDVYIMMIMKVAERLKRLYWSSSNSTGTHDLWQKGLPSLPAHVCFKFDLGWHARLRRECQLSKQNFKDLKITCSFRNASSRSVKWQGFPKQVGWQTNMADSRLT